MAFQELAQHESWTACISLQECDEVIKRCMEQWPRRIADALEKQDRLNSLGSLCCACPWSVAHVPLACGHGLCERDAWKYSTRSTEYGTKCRIETCPSCDELVNCFVRLRPPQAGYRVAAFDGGGALGIVSLEVLQQVLNMLPRHLLPHQFFDFFIGTSTGKS